MLSRQVGILLVVATLLTLVLSACQQPEVVGGFEIPVTKRGKFNVAMVLIGPHDDGGWSQAHYEGLQYIQENMGRTIRREDLARVAGLSVPRFHVLFTKAFGRAPMDFVRDERMRRARRMLLWTDMPVAEVAWACGYPDQYHFSRAFKAHEGMPPTHYRRVTRERGG